MKTREYSYVRRFWSCGVIFFPKYNWFFGVQATRYGVNSYGIEFGIGFVLFWIARDNIEVVS